VNIFYLDNNPGLAALYHCDKHVIKMILETAQIMSTVVHKTFPDKYDSLYKATHAKHPCVLWAGAGEKNFQWLYELGICLNREFELRYSGKSHASMQIIHECAEIDLKLEPVWTSPAQAMPEECKDADPVVAYRNYYTKYKQHIITYKNTSKPYWMSA
jgi:hypothetical protein